MRSFLCLIIFLGLSHPGMGEELPIADGHPSIQWVGEAPPHPEHIKETLAEVLQHLIALNPNTGIETTLKIDRNALFAASSAMETHWGGQQCVISIHEDLLSHLDGNEARMAFTLAHELSHCLRGDIVARAQSHTVNPMQNWRQEYQADQNAARMLKKLGYNVDHGAEILNYLGRGCSKTHPPRDARLRALMTGQQMGYRECVQADAEGPVRLSQRNE